MDEWLPQLQMLAFVANAIVVLIVLPLRKSIEQLQASDDRLANRIQALEVKVAEQYIRRGEVVSALTDIVTKLDRIEARMDSKIDALDHQKADK